MTKEGSISLGQISLTVKPGISVNTPSTSLGPAACRLQSTLTGVIGRADSVVDDPQAAHIATRTAASAAALIRAVSGTIDSIRCVPWKILVVILGRLWPRWRC